MSQSTRADNNSVVGTTAAQTETTSRTVVVNAVTEDLRLADWNVFRTVADASADTIHRLRE